MMMLKVSTKMSIVKPSIIDICIVIIINVFNVIIINSS